MNAETTDQSPLPAETILTRAATEIANLLDQAPLAERFVLVKALGETLTTASVAVVDTSDGDGGSYQPERIGVVTGRKHDAVAAAGERLARQRRQVLRTSPTLYYYHSV